MDTLFSNPSSQFPTDFPAEFPADFSDVQPMDLGTLERDGWNHAPPISSNTWRLSPTHEANARAQSSCVFCLMPGHQTRDCPEKKNGRAHKA